MERVMEIDNKDIDMNAVFEYNRYMFGLIEKLNSISTSIMSIVQECGCEKYQHVGNGYMINIEKDPEGGISKEPEEDILMV